MEMCRFAPQRDRQNILWCPFFSILYIILVSFIWFPCALSIRSCTLAGEGVTLERHTDYGEGQLANREGEDRENEM